MARLINQQGKAQLKLSFGSAEHPQCQGLTLDQLAQIDFSKLDLSELFEEIFAKTTTPNTTRISKDIQKSMSNKTYFLNDKEKKITQGRPHGDF
jgi:conjugal transfer mating pair stabilization protein TraN